MPGKNLFLILLVIGCLKARNSEQLLAQNIEVTVTGIKTQKGQIAIGVFTDDACFQTDKTLIEIQFPKNELKNGVMTVALSLEPGTYGLAVLDDVNNNRLMEYGFLGIPKEGFGFSDYYHTGLFKPKFNDFRFTVVEGEQKKITVRMRYF